METEPERIPIGNWDPLFEHCKEPQYTSLVKEYVKTCKPDSIVKSHALVTNPIEQGM